MFDFNLERTGKNRMARKPRHTQSRWPKVCPALLERGSIGRMACKSAEVRVHSQILNENHFHSQVKFFN